MVAIPTKLACRRGDEGHDYRRSHRGRITATVGMQPLFPFLGARLILWCGAATALPPSADHTHTYDDAPHRADRLAPFRVGVLAGLRHHLNSAPFITPIPTFMFQIRKIQTDSATRPRCADLRTRRPWMHGETAWTQRTVARWAKNQPNRSTARPRGAVCSRLRGHSHVYHSNDIRSAVMQHRGPHAHKTGLRERHRGRLPSSICSRAQGHHQNTVRLSEWLRPCNDRRLVSACGS